MGMAEGNAQGVGLVQPHLALQAENQAHHVLHLLLLGRAAAHQGLLDLARAVFVDGQLQGDGGGNGGTPGMAQLEGGRGVLGDEDLLDGDLVRPLLVDQGAYALEDLAQTAVEVVTLGTDTAAGQVAAACGEG